MANCCVLCKSSEHLQVEDNLLVCTDCGVVLDEEDLLQDEENGRPLPNNSNDFCNLNHHTLWMRKELANKDLQTSSKKEAKQMLDHCMSHFRFTGPMQQDAKQLFVRLVNSVHFYRCSVKTKLILSGVCAYLVMNKFDCVTTKNAVAKVIGCTVFEFGAIYKRALEQAKVSKPKFFTMDQHVAGIVNSLQFEQHEKPQIENIVTELIRLQVKCSLIDSRFPLNVILAASFCAWKCVAIKQRLDVKLSDFVRQLNIQNNLTRHVARLTGFLIDLCRCIPWIVDKKRVNKRTICFYVQDVLDHPETLVADYLKSKGAAIDVQVAQQESDLPLLKRKVEQPNEREIADDPISDGEIDSYIRSDEEVRLLKKLRSSAALDR